MSSHPPLPPGFTLDSAPSPMPPLPAGFTPDQQSQRQSRSDPFPGDDLLSDDAMSRLAAGERSAVTPSRQPSMLERAGRYVSDYAGGIKQALQPADGPRVAADYAAGLAPLYGAAEAALSIGSGMLAPFAAFTDPSNPEAAAQRVIYEPRSQAGRTALGLVGAVAKPAIDAAESTGADVALMPVAAEAQALQRGTRHAREASDFKAAAKQADRQRPPAPTAEELGASARQAYSRAKEAGAVAAPEGYARMASGTRTSLRDQGFNQKLHPKAAAVVEEIENAGAQGPVSFDELEILRRQALAAERSIEPDERRIASLIVDRLDDYADALASGAEPVLGGNAPAAVAARKEARGLYSRNRKAMEIQELIERAQIRASQFSGSGEENALRTEFRQLAMNPKRLRRFNKEEQGAIKEVAFGTKSSNALRQLGKLAPTGGLSQWLSIGATMLNPFAAIVPATGAAARYGATRMTRGAAQRAEELMRRGPPRSLEPEVTPTPAAQAVSGELMPRDPLALPAPSMIAGSRSAPGTAFSREQMGMTPDVERAGALHPGVARQSQPQRPAALPLHPERAPEPIVVDPSGRAGTATALDSYLDEMGLREVRRQSPLEHLAQPVETDAAPRNRLSQLAPPTLAVSEIRSLVKRVRENPSDNTRAVIEYENVVHPAAVDAFQQAGIDVTGYKHVIDNSAIRHILKRHGGGRETSRGRMPVTEDDFARLPEIIGNPDAVEYAGKTGIGRDAVRYAKLLDGDIVVVEEARARQGQLAVVSMWKVARNEPVPSVKTQSSAHTSQTLRGTLPHAEGNSTTPGEHIEMRGRNVRSSRAPIEHIPANRFEQLRNH